MARALPVRLLASAAAIALATSLCDTASAAAQTPTAGGAGGSNAPQRRAERIPTFSVPLVWAAAVRGDVTVRIAPDNSVTIDAQSLRDELRPLLNESGIAALDAAIGAQPFVDQAVLRAAGFDFEFDMSRLELRLDRIAAQYRPVESIETRRDTENTLPITHQPAGFSAYLNTNVGLIYRDGQGVVPPDVFWLGAARIGRLVVEGEAGFTDSIGGNRFFRRGVRATYDEPERCRRWSAGDLRLFGSPLATLPSMGGLALQRSRRTFDPTFSFRALGGRRIQVDTPSTVEVLVNGAPYRTLDLQPGTYDLSNLPIETGANDIQLVVRDAAGREQITRFDMFFDPPDLEAGDFEYTIGVGVVSDNFGLAPRYDGPIAAIANYRRAISGNLLVGGGFQASTELQLATGEVRFVPQVIPGTFDIELGANTGRSSGVAARLGYRWFDANPQARQSISMTIDYQGRGFRTLADLDFFSLERLSGTANYSRALTDLTNLNVGASYTRVSGIGSQSSLYADVNHRLNRRLVGTVGVEYGQGNALGRNFGIRIGISYRLGARDRVDGLYQSRRDYARLALSRSLGNEVGSLGYGLSLIRSAGMMGLEGSADYIGNRFDARLTLSSQGTGIGGITDRRTARLQLGSSIGYADGAFGIGRQIDDAFVVARPVGTVRDADAVLGRSLAGGRYEASSGTFGAAVLGRLQSYDTQTMRYDLKGPAEVYDIGEGLARIKPPYRAGYKIIVGSERNVSVVGNLQADGKAVALVAGRVESVDDEGFEAVPFVTNSSGRFGVMGLAPGKRYLVRLSDGRTFTIQVPKDSGNLLRLDDVGVTGSGK